ncbi:MAG: hypothetical protein JJV89_03460 [Desulfosarcina sp.]|nr:hypothetical protein [Desulfobacterales bacterium]
MACSCSTKITLAGNGTVGDSLLNPLNAEWLIAANKYHDWECIETADGINIIIHTNIEIGDGVTPTFFKDVGKNFVFDAGKDFILNPPAYLEVTGVWTQTEKDLLLSQVADIHTDVEDLQEPDNYLEKLHSATFNNSELTRNSETSYTEKITTENGESEFAITKSGDIETRTPV